MSIDLFMRVSFCGMHIAQCQVGGLLGGAAMSWLLGPALKYEYTSADGSRIFSDRAPIFHLINWKRKT